MQRICLYQIFQVIVHTSPSPPPLFWRQSSFNSHSNTYLSSISCIRRFTHAALAFEGVGGKYRAVFAEPKSSARSSTTDRSNSRYDEINLIGEAGGSSNHSNRSSSAAASEYAAYFNSSVSPGSRTGDSSSVSVSGASASGGNGTGAASTGANSGSNEVQLHIIVSTSVNQDQLWRLCDIVPGLDYCHITGKCNRNSNYAIAAYNTFERAQYARCEASSYG